MPFPVVWGIPKNTPTSVLNDLRKGIVKAVSEGMGCPTNWVRPFFPADLIEGPEGPTDGCATIFVSLETAMFHGKESQETDKKAQALMQALAQVVSDAFGGEYEVEAFVNSLNFNWRFLIKRKE